MQIKGIEASRCLPDSYMYMKVYITHDQLQVLLISGDVYRYSVCTL